jgi:hypothetical protein
MSTLAEIEAAATKLGAAELEELERERRDGAACLLYMQQASRVSAGGL